MENYLLAPFLAFVGSTLALLVIKQLAQKSGFVDEPDPASRKKHSSPVPPVGGLIVFPFGIVFSAAAGFDWIENWPLCAAISIMLVVGLIDDLYEIPSTVKLFFQVFAALLLVLPGNALLSDLGNLMGTGEFNLGLFSVPFSLFCIVLLINALNMIDGLDGLSGGVGLIVLSSLAIFSFLSGTPGFITLILPFIAALAGFWVLNMRFPWQKRAQIFFGDSGTLALGCLIAWLTISVYNNSEGQIPSMALGWLLAFSVMDAFALFVLRLSQRRSPFSADRFHFHHILRDSGFHASTAVLIILSIHIIYALIAMAAFMYPTFPEWMFFYPWVMILALHSLIIFKARKAEDFLQRFLT